MLFFGFLCSLALDLRKPEFLEKTQEGKLAVFVSTWKVARNEVHLPFESKVYVCYFVHGTAIFSVKNMAWHPEAQRHSVACDSQPSSAIANL